MKEIATDGIAELLAAIGYGAGTVLLTVLGIEAELFGAQSFGADPILTVWGVALGAVALYFGLYVVGYERLVPHLREIAR